MVKRVPVLEGVDAEAGVRYEDTRLARQAVVARRRLTWILAAGAAGFALEALLRSEPAWLLGTLLVLLTIWRVRAGMLGGVVLLTLVSVIGTLVSLALLVRAGDVVERITLAVTLVWAAAMLPDVVLLARDAELQHAYGLWARRER